jgi:hypothetical protein
MEPAQRRQRRERTGTAGNTDLVGRGQAKRRTGEWAKGRYGERAIRGAKRCSSEAAAHDSLEGEALGIAVSPFRRFAYVGPRPTKLARKT